MCKLEDKIVHPAPMQKPNFQWQGEPVTVEFGFSIIQENTDRPLYWYNYECFLNGDMGRTAVESIRITCGNGEQFVIANHFNIGVNKLLNGGWPNHKHSSLPDDGFYPDLDDLIKPEDLIFNEEEYAEHEAARDKYFEQNYPEDFARLEALKKEGMKLYKNI